MPGSLKLALIATLAGLGAVSAQEPSRVPDKSVDFCSVVHKHSITQFYSDCSGIGTFPTPAPRVKPTNLPKFPYHSVIGAKETAAPEIPEIQPRADEERHSKHMKPTGKHAKPTGKPDGIHGGHSIPHGIPTGKPAHPHEGPADVAARDVPDHVTFDGIFPDFTHKPESVHHAKPTGKPVGVHGGHSIPHGIPTGLPKHHGERPTDVAARDFPIIPDFTHKPESAHHAKPTGKPAGVHGGHSIPHGVPTGQPKHHGERPTDVAARDVPSGVKFDGIFPIFTEKPEAPHSTQPTDDDKHRSKHHAKPTGKVEHHSKPLEEHHSKHHAAPTAAPDAAARTPERRAAAGPGEDHPTMVDDGDEMPDEVIPHAIPTSVAGEKPTGRPDFPGMPHVTGKPHHTGRPHASGHHEGPKPTGPVPTFLPKGPKGAEGFGGPGPEILPTSFVTSATA